MRRLLQRVGFGPRPGELDRAAAAGFDATLSALLLLPLTDDGPAPPVFEPLPTGREQRRAANELVRTQVEQLRRWWLERMIAAERPSTERLTFFWHGVFATSVQKVRSASMMSTQHQTLRRLGAGELRALVAAMTVDPAMLVWLDGQRNQRGRPNENLARELMELFTIGVGHYTEDDVRQAARALTGWRVDRAAGTASFEQRRHDGAELTVLGHTGRMGVDELVGVLAGHPRCPRFIAERMWQRFVSDTPPSAQRLDELAGHAASAGELLHAVLASPEFRAPESVLVRQPVEWLVAAHRALGVPLGDQAVGGLRSLGQVLFAPPSVGGWPAGPAWLTTSAARSRLAVAGSIAADADLPALRARPQGERVHAAGELLSLDWTDRTAAALAEAAGDPRELIALALVSPENLVSG